MCIQYVVFVNFKSLGLHNITEIFVRLAIWFNWSKEHCHNVTIEHFDDALKGHSGTKAMLDKIEQNDCQLPFQTFMF